MTLTSPARHDSAELLSATARRRTFAIISHPDAGKTTLTEKLLLFSGAVDEAGSVRARRQSRSTVSDWMEMERRRGISVSSTVLRFEHGGHTYNLVDTPGHADFSEDTYRTLWAVDAALMVLDAGRGLEPQTLKLFQVCRLRGLPIITFINKCDRPMLSPLALLDQIEDQIGIHPVPLNWPIGLHGNLAGLLDIGTDEVVESETTVHGATAGEARRTLAGAWDPSGVELDWAEAREEVALVAGAIDPADVLAERVTPVFFGSALTNVGLPMLLEHFPAFAPPPAPTEAADGAATSLDDQFSAQIFKVQANTDPRHRDRVAFMRISSGRFERGMTAFNQRTGRRLSLSYSSELFGQERQTIDVAVPGDVIGVVNAAGEEEGVIRVLHRPDGMGDPIVGVVGELQLEVAVERLTNEFGCRVERTPTAWEACRAIEPRDAARIPPWRNLQVVVEASGRTLVLATSPFVFERLDREIADLQWETTQMSRGD